MGLRTRGTEGLRQLREWTEQSAGDWKSSGASGGSSGRQAEERGRPQGAALALGARISGERRIPAKMNLERRVRSGAWKGHRDVSRNCEGGFGERSGGEAGTHSG